MTALFKKSKKSADEPKPVKAKTIKVEKVKHEDAAAEGTSRGGVSGGFDRSSVLIRPHVTEKATDLSGKGVYVFDIHQHANKMQVREAVEKLYKVKPTRVNIMNKKPKLMKNPRTGRIQMKGAGIKKALVYLKEGDKIEFV